MHTPSAAPLEATGLGPDDMSEGALGAVHISYEEKRKAALMELRQLTWKHKGRRIRQRKSSPSN